jgi:hypothetical protein
MTSSPSLLIPLRHLRHRRPQAAASRGRAGPESEEALGHARVKLRFARSQRGLGRPAVALARGREARAMLVRELWPAHPLAADAVRFVAQLEQSAMFERDMRPM